MPNVIYTSYYLHVAISTLVYWRKCEAKTAAVLQYGEPPIVIDLTIDDSEEDSPNTIEEAPNACNQSDEEELSTDDEEIPHSCKRIKVELNHK